MEPTTTIKETQAISSDCIYTIPSDYEFVEVRSGMHGNQEVVMRKKKAKYPKTYEECCKLLYPNGDDFNLYLSRAWLDVEEINILDTYIKLRRCRNAYWKLAGNWTPAKEGVTKRICIFYDCGSVVKGEKLHYIPKFLEFPNEEMRDAFYDNFKRSINKCKAMI